MPGIKQQTGNTMLIALAGILVVIILIGLFMNHRSAQKIQQITAANEASMSTDSTENATGTANTSGNDDAGSGYGNSSAQGSNRGTSPTSSQQPTEYPPDAMDRNIKHMNQYNKELVVYSNQQNNLIDEWNVLKQKSYGQDRLAIRDTLEKMVNVYERLDRLATPECKRKEKHQWMRNIQEGIDKLNVSDSGPIVSFYPVSTPDVVAYDCFASMPLPK